MYPVQWNLKEKAFRSACGWWWWWGGAEVGGREQRELSGAVLLKPDRITRS